MRLAYLVVAAALALPTAAAVAADAERGAYLVRIMDCTACHTPGALMGEPDMTRELAGSDIGWDIPGLGVFYPPNLTPDPETGLGNWSEAEIATALREGKRPDGRILAPAMPWMSYAGLTDEDVAAIAAYLKSLKPVVNRVPEATAVETARAPYFTVVTPEKRS